MMGRVIQMVYVTKDDCLFLLGITKKEEIVFRSSKNIAYLQKGKLVIDGDMCFTNLYHFSIFFLEKLSIIEQ